MTPENLGNSLIVGLPYAVLNTSKRKSVARGLVQNYEFEGTGQNQILRIHTSSQTKVKRAFKLPSNASGIHRIVIDLVTSTNLETRKINPVENQVNEKTVTSYTTETSSIISHVKAMSLPSMGGIPLQTAPQQMSLSEWAQKEQKFNGGNFPQPVAPISKAIPSSTNQISQEQPSKKVLETVRGAEIEVAQTDTQGAKENRTFTYKDLFGDKPAPSDNFKSNFYVGASYGLTWRDTGVSNLTGSAKLDEEDTGFKLFGGANLNKYFGIEAFYANLGDAALSGKTGDTFTYQGDAYVFTANGTITDTTTTYGLGGVASMDLTPSLKPFLKAGIHRWTTERGETSSAGNYSADVSGVDPFYGLGIRLRATDTINLRAEYEYFQGDENNNFELLSLGMQYNF